MHYFVLDCSIATANLGCENRDLLVVSLVSGFVKDIIFMYEKFNDYQKFPRITSFYQRAQKMAPGPLQSLTPSSAMAASLVQHQTLQCSVLRCHPTLHNIYYWLFLGASVAPDSLMSPPAIPGTSPGLYTSYTLLSITKLSNLPPVWLRQIHPCSAST